MTQPSARTAEVSEFAAEVREGLARVGQKTLPCRYFYDEAGSALFEKISRLPEYGLTRADERIIRAHAGELSERLRDRFLVAELGSGSGRKTRHILEALGQREPVRYFPIDISGSALDDCRRLLTGVAAVEPVEDTYLNGLDSATRRRSAGERMLVLFLGSTIGNLDRREACQFLRDIRSRLRAGDALMLGADLVKPEETLVRAYDDAGGVTAAFNLNLLSRINRELGGGFDLDLYRHEARYDHDERRVEMHLRSLDAHSVRVPAAGIEISMREGESIWTESSYKFDAAELREMSRSAGFACAAQWLDQEWPFAETLLLA